MTMAEFCRVTGVLLGKEEAGMLAGAGRLEKRFSGPHDLAVFVGVDNVLNQRRDPDLDGAFRPVEGRRVLAGVRGALRFEPLR